MYKIGASSIHDTNLTSNKIQNRLNAGQKQQRKSERQSLSHTIKISVYVETLALTQMVYKTFQC